MTSLSAGSVEIELNPLDALEDIMSSREMYFERADDEELAAEFIGRWCDFRLLLSWRPEVNSILISCAYDSKVPEYARKNLYQLLALANERMWIGHFDICSQSGYISFRHTIVLRKNAEVNADLMDELFDIIFNECEQFYPAFQGVLWGGMAAEEALEAALMETAGSA